MARLSLSDGDLWYEETGPSDARALVFVHGGWMDGDAWRDQVERFAPEYRVVTVDLRGHGRTGETDRWRYSVDLFTDDLAALVDHLDVERPVLCGISLGSMVVQTYLARHPDEVAGAVMAGPVRSMTPVDLPRPMTAALSPVPMVAASVALGGPLTTFRTLLASLRAATGGPWLTVDPVTRERATEAVAGMSTGEFRKVFAALYHFEAPALDDVDVPALLVYGEGENRQLKSQAAQLAEVLDGRLREVPDAAHLVNQDNPEAFNAELATFLATLADGAA